VSPPFTARPISLLATVKTSVFSFTVCTFPTALHEDLQHIPEADVYHLTFKVRMLHVCNAACTSPLAGCYIYVTPRMH
jgi:hypothetical protein